MSAMEAASLGPLADELATEPQSRFLASARYLGWR